MAAAASATSSSSAAAAAAPAAGVTIPVVERSSVANIAARYRGQALVHRLSFLAEVDPAQRSEALALALTTAKACGRNAAQVLSLSEAAGVDPDSAWLEDTTKRVEATATGLERELNMRLAAQDRDGIMVRQGHQGRLSWPILAAKSPPSQGSPQLAPASRVPGMFAFSIALAPEAFPHPLAGGSYEARAPPRAHRPGRQPHPVVLAGQQVLPPPPSPPPPTNPSSPLQHLYT